MVSGLYKIRELSTTKYFELFGERSIDCSIVIICHFLFRLALDIPTDPEIGQGDDNGFETDTINGKY